MLLHEFVNQDRIVRRQDSIIAEFSGKRRIISTSPLNGGFRDNLTHAFIHCAERTEDAMLGETYSEHIRATGLILGLDTNTMCGISTGAYAENAAIETRSFKDTEITALVTAGIDVNGGRSGDPAQWHEADTGYFHVPGTINIMLFCNNNLTEGALARALITSTEAKSAAISELAVPSRYSRGLATGSGTDGVIIVADATSGLTLTEAGNHFKLGELIGQAVSAAVKKALYLETGLNTSRQFNVFRRLDRFGLNHKHLTNKILLSLSESKSNLPSINIENSISDHFANRKLVVQSIIFAHLLDELSYGLISLDDFIEAINNALISYHGNQFSNSSDVIVKFEIPDSSDQDINSTINKFISFYSDFLVFSFLRSF